MNLCADSVIEPVVGQPVSAAAHVQGRVCIQSLAPRFGAETPAALFEAFPGKGEAAASPADNAGALL
eukprot:1090030-Alexandrium_andersonii.AAC.1